MKNATSRIVGALLLTWLLPGTGHLRYGLRAKALLFSANLLVLFAVGIWLGEGRVVHPDRFPLYLLAQIWLGGPTLAVLLLTRDLRITHDIAHLDAGLLFTAVAGLLNLVVLVDLYEHHLRTREQRA